MNRHVTPEDSDLYALGALDGAEMQELEAHVRSCAEGAGGADSGGWTGWGEAGAGARICVADAGVWSGGGGVCGGGGGNLDEGCTGRSPNPRVGGAVGSGADAVSGDCEGVGGDEQAAGDAGDEARVADADAGDGEWARGR